MAFRLCIHLNHTHVLKIPEGEILVTGNGFYWNCPSCKKRGKWAWSTVSYAQSALALHKGGHPIV